MGPKLLLALKQGHREEEVTKELRELRGIRGHRVIKEKKVK